MGVAASVDSVNVSNGFGHRGGSSVVNRRRSAASSHSSGSSYGTRNHSATAPAQSDVFKSLVDTKFSFETAYAKVDPVMRELARFQSARTDVITPALDFLFSYTSSKYGADISRMWVEKLEKNGLVSIVMKLWPSFWDPDLLQCANKDSGNGVQKDNITLENFWFVCRTIWNGSDCSAVLCRSLVETGTVEEMLKIVARKDFDPAAMKKDEVRSYISKAATGIVHNCLRNCYDEAQQHFMKADGVNIFLPYMRSDLPLLAIKATVVLAYVAPEAGDQLIDHGDDMVKTMLRKLLEPALSRSSRKSHGFATVDSLLALSHLAEVEANKSRMVQQGILPLCLKHKLLIGVYHFKRFYQIFEHADSDVELQHAIRLVWMLSFNDETLNTFKGMPALISAVESHRASPIPPISRAATGIMWNVVGSLPDAAGSTKRTHSGPPSSKRSINVVKNTDIPVFTDRNTSARSLPVSSTRRRPPSTQVEDRKRSRSRPNISDIKEEKDRPPEHIMISYDHSFKTTVYELNRSLKEAGYVTWLDVERLSGQTLEAAIEAVDNAAVVCVCASQHMQLSLTCRTELEHAVREEKPLLVVQLEKPFHPAGWLRAVLNHADASSHFVCTSPANISRCVQKMAEKLGARAKVAVVASEETESKHTTSKHPDKHPRHHQEDHKSEMKDRPPRKEDGKKVDAAKAPPEKEMERKRDDEAKHQHHHSNSHRSRAHDESRDHKPAANDPQLKSEDRQKSVERHRNTGKERRHRDRDRSHGEEEPKVDSNGKSESSRHRHNEEKEEQGNEAHKEAEDKSPPVVSASNGKPDKPDSQPSRHREHRTHHKSSTKHTTGSRKKTDAKPDEKTNGHRERSDASEATSAEGDNDLKEEEEEADQVPKADDTDGPPARPTSAWSRDHVRGWLADNGLAHLAPKFGKIDGGLLLELRAMYHKSPNVFYANARDDLGMNELSDLLRMTQLLDQIPDE